MVVNGVGIYTLVTVLDLRVTSALVSGRPSVILTVTYMYLPVS